MQNCQDQSLLLYFPETSSPLSNPADVWSLWPGRRLIRQLAGQQLRSIAYLFSRENNTSGGAKLNTEDCKLDELIYLKPCVSIHIHIYIYNACLTEKSAGLIMSISTTEQATQRISLKKTQEQNAKGERNSGAEDIPGVHSRGDYFCTKCGAESPPQNRHDSPSLETVTADNKKFELIGFSLFCVFL